MTDIRILETPEDFFLYDTWVKAHPQGSLWQSLEWKRYQEALGRKTRIYAAEAPHPNPLPRGEGTFLASAMVVIDRTTGGWSTWDMPRGPLWTANSGERLAARVLEQVVEDAKKNLCLTLSLSPPRTLPAARCPLVASQRHEQPEATRMIDLTPSEDAILAQMHPKGRYNIKVAQKNGVLVEQSDDVEAFYGLLQQTAGRDGFRILPLKAYKTFLERLPGSFLLIAYLPPPPAPSFREKAPTPSPSPVRGRGESPFSPAGGKGPGDGGKPIAGLIGVVWGQTGIYYYGASAYAHRALMAPYALQWEAMRLCKTKGCTTYDLLGIVVPDPLSPNPSPAAAGEGGTPLSLTLSRGERETDHQWAGVSAFKEKFGGTVVTYPPEQQIVLRPVLWRALQWKRWIAG